MDQSSQPSNQQDLTSTPPPPAALRSMASGYWVSQAVYVAAKLGIADILADGSKHHEGIAQTVGANSSALYRLLRALASVGVFCEEEQGCFGNTPLSALLQTDVPGSLRAWVVMLNEEQYRAWGDLLHSIQTGDTAFGHVFGKELFPYLAEHPGAAEVFNTAMTDFATHVAVGAVQAYDFSGFERIVDVGGGHGILLTSILQANSHLYGVLFDIEHVVADAQKNLEAAGLADRSTVVAGNFFEAVPSGGDVYILARILHDWDDAQSLAILKNCHRAMREQDRLLIVETVLSSGNEPSFGKLLDLHMLVVTGGCERTETEHRALLEQAGFSLARVIPTQALTSVVEGIRM